MANNIDVRQMLPQGTLLHEGAYRIDSYLASGGFGNTYIATNMAFGERVAIKEFFLRGQSERTQNMNSIRVTQGQELFFKEQQTKFKKEAQRIRQLRNPHIVRVHDLFDANGTTYYVMDFIEGESVAARIKAKSAPLSEDETIYILSQVLDALNDVHAAGLYHLDIKPDNILIDKNGNAFIIDFGASKQQSVNNDGVSRTSAFACTPEYAPLELTTGNVSNIGPWSDIYSVGATAYMMLTNHVPPKSDELLVDMDSAFQFTANVSAKMRKFIQKCMEINYRQRPQSAEEALALLDSQVVASQKPEPFKQPRNADSTQILTSSPLPSRQQYQYDEPFKVQPKTLSCSKWWIIGSLSIAAIAALLIFVLMGKGSESSEKEVLANEPPISTEIDEAEQTSQKSAKESDAYEISTEESNNTGIGKQKESKISGPYSFANRKWGMYLTGVIGGAKNSHLAVWDGGGGFSYNAYANDENGLRIRRYIDNFVFNQNTGELTFDALDPNTNKVLSSFSGKLVVVSGYTLSYDGHFTNYKGVSMDVHLKGELWDSEPEGDWSDAWWY